MENHYANLFRVILLNCFVFLSFTEVKSAPVAPSIIDVMKNDSKLECPAARFLYDSEYIKHPCASTAYPTAPLTLETLDNFLCLGVYDTAYKICQYSSQLQIPLNSTAMFNSYVEKYIPNKAQKDFCNNLQGFTSLYDKIDSFLKQLVKSLNVPRTCEVACFNLEDNFRPLCAVLAWIKNSDDVINAKKIETKHDTVVTDKSYMIQEEKTSNGKTKPIESKKIEIKESKEQNGKQIITDSNNNNNNVKEGNSNVPDNVPLVDAKFNEERIKSDTETTNNIQKKINNTSEKQAHKSVPLIFQENKENTDTELDINTAIEKSIKDIPPSDDSQGVSKNKPTNNINKSVINEGIAENSNKEQNINEYLKPSTISENTQDHYDAENPEGNMENDIDGINICKYELIMCIVINVYMCIRPCV